jgi:predicted ArsR family transcriptional regulator
MSTTQQQQLEAEIEAQREQLAVTVDALAARLDVKAQARDHIPQLAAAGLALVVLAVGWSLARRRSS